MRYVTITVVPDAAETWIADEMGSRVGKSNVVRLPMPVGDIAIECADVKIELERKRSEDLAASISTGHWEAQRERLCSGPDDAKQTHFALLGHGPMPDMSNRPFGKHGKITNKAMRSSIMRTQYAHNIPVFWASGDFELLEVVGHLHGQMLKHGATMFSPKPVGQYAAMGGKLPRDGRNDPKATLVAMLTLINGVSRARATIIADAMPSVHALVGADVKQIAELELKGRKFGLPLAKRVLDVFQTHK